jgi:hypothetical protein
MAGVTAGVNAIGRGRITPWMEGDPLDWYERLASLPAPSVLGGGSVRVRNLGLRLVLYVATSGAIVRDLTLSLRAPSGEYYSWGQIWRRQIFPAIMVDSAATILSRTYAWTLIRPQSAGLQAFPEQRYRDGRVGHCFFDPIRAYWSERHDNAKSESTKESIRRLLARLQKLADVFAAGIPEGAIDGVAKSLQVRVRIADMFGENPKDYNDGYAYGKRFGYRNVRWNHLEACTSEWTLERVSPGALIDLRKSLQEDGKTYLLRKNASGLIVQLDTPSGRFVLDDPDRDVFQAARDAYCLDGSAIDAVKEPFLAAFCESGCRVTSHARLSATKPADPDDFHVVDLKAAYTQGPLVGEYFQGYLGAISDVRRVELTGPAARAFLASHVGLFCVSDVESYECSEVADAYLEAFRLWGSSTLVLPSCELLFLWDLGARFRVRSGAWGTSIPAIDWEGLHLLEPATGPLFAGTSRYKVWCGQLGHSNRGVKRCWFPGTADWSAYLRSRGYDALYYDFDGDVCVQRDAKRSPANHQTFAFVTAYTRIAVLQKLLAFNPASVRGVQLDSIVYVGDTPVGAETAEWRVKPDIGADVLSEYSRDGWYGFDRGYDDAWITAPASAIDAPVTFLEGAGGSGKSHSVLADPGFRDVLFAAPTWSLVCFMATKYKRAGTTVHRLAGEWLDEETGKLTKCRAYHEEQRRYPAVVFVDEATMIDKRMLAAVLKTYGGRSKIVIGGDIRVSGIPAEKPPIWFQCRNRTQVFDPREHGCALLSYAEDYRATGILVELKKTLRAAMVDVFLASSADDPGDDVLDAHAVTGRVQSLFAAYRTTKAACLGEYAPGDAILVGTHELADEWTDALKDRDEKYRIVRHSAADVLAAQEGREAYLTGEITSKRTDRGVFCLAFTIHSFQGKTFEGRRLWIDARRVWDYAMLYTAISRCQTADQIRILFD